MNCVYEDWEGECRRPRGALCPLLEDEGLDEEEWEEEYDEEEDE